MKKTHNFEAETGRILELLTHSIYSNKEIFLREIISNSSDAVDKARLKSITDTTFLKEGEKFEIKLDIDKEKGTITITDNGIGMTEDELHKNLGTIAKSGTKEFVDKLKAAKENSEHNLIGQFGVGFYSAFMVADSVEVTSNSANNGNEAFKWTSDGKTGYEVSKALKEGRGTEIKMFINEANKELLEDWKIRELVKKYSNYVGTPIMMKELDNRNDEDKKKEPNKVFNYEKINETTAIWKKGSNSVKEEEYQEFYKTISSDFNKPLCHIHSSVEGMVSYKTLLYIPLEKNMFKDIRDPSQEYGPKLYVQNVLILDNAKELLPVWLRFVSGVVETSDLPLNISREMLQSNATLDKIKKALVKKVISELKKMSRKEPENYAKFLDNFGEVLKEGIHYEAELKESIAELLDFKSINESKKISLDVYLENCKTEKEEDKKTIYYITGKSQSEVLASPYLAQFRENKVDVLLLTDHIDSFIVQTLNEYKGANLKSITADDIELGETTEEDKKEKEEKAKEFKDLLELTKNTIGAEKIEKVELNDKLGSALGALKTPTGGVDPQMEKMMKAMGQPVPSQKRVLELNPKNALVSAMQKEFKADIKSEKLSDLMKYAYNQAVLLEGGELENIAEFVELTNKFAGGYIK
ncbi:MAG: molecular chaperone HtpG [Candidatus Gracilibacteria bacterium]|nr:molecular chaperone HtpG [Candidatus Gracilibacteria bacterium]MDQ7023894.1 molecular chaperone HtpG [Candidatus Gracilibacteria bacterium]